MNGEGREGGRERERQEKGEKRKKGRQGGDKRERFTMFLAHQE